MRVAIVTGAAGGIGYAVTQKLIENGCAVVGMNRRPYADVADKFDGFGDAFTYVQGDLSSAADRATLLETAVAKYGRVDILVNVAGVAPKVRRDILEMTEESYDYVMSIEHEDSLMSSSEGLTKAIEALKDVLIFEDKGEMFWA